MNLFRSVYTHHKKTLPTPPLTFHSIRLTFSPMRSLVFALLLLVACAAESRTLTISAASNLQIAFTEIGAAFEKESGARVIFNYGATGQLAQQIAQGAPVDVFVAADRATLDDLIARGLIARETVANYARGQIVTYTRGDQPAPALAELARPEIKRIAIANPERAPYGKAARQALHNAGILAAVESKIIYAENIQQTQQYADTGAVDVAIIARSLTIHTRGRWSEIPQNLYAPIDQAIGVVASSKNQRDARAFVAFMLSDAGRAVLLKYGYAMPNHESQ
ncbi:MAG: molybdate ABC transporter substrate-binding protein [Chloroflexi bacterium]|nr:molybdate ABC transporter substrate-binding protein [Chloroflexota bacterium]